METFSTFLEDMASSYSMSVQASLTLLLEILILLLFLAVIVHVMFQPQILTLM